MEPVLTNRCSAASIPAASTRTRLREHEQSPWCHFAAAHDANAVGTGVQTPESSLDQAQSDALTLPQASCEALALKGIHARESTHGSLIKLDCLEGFVRDGHALLELGKLPLEFGAELRELVFGEIGHGPACHGNPEQLGAVAEHWSEIALPFKVLSVPAREVCRRRVRTLEKGVERSIGRIERYAPPRRAAQIHPGPRARMRLRVSRRTRKTPQA